MSTNPDIQGIRFARSYLGQGHMGIVIETQRCTRCGALVGSIPEHLDWHTRIEQVPFVQHYEPPKPSRWDTATIGEKWAQDFLRMPRPPKDSDD